MKRDRRCCSGGSWAAGGMTGYMVRSSGISLHFWAHRHPVIDEIPHAAPFAKRRIRAPLRTAHKVASFHLHSNGQSLQRLHGVWPASKTARAMCVLPIPGSPPIITMEPRPASASFNNRFNSANSRSRPIRGISGSPRRPNHVSLKDPHSTVVSPLALRRIEW